MKKKILTTLSLALVFTMLLGISGALALGSYDYDALGANAGIFVDGSSIAIDDANVTVQGEITAENDTVAISGVMMDYAEIGDWTAGGSSASGEASGDSSEEASGESSGEASAVQAGQTGIVIRGNVDSTLIAVGGDEDLYTAPDGREYNTVILLRAEDADVENALNPGTTRSLLDNDVETVPGVGLAVVGDLVTVDNTYIQTEGANRSAFLNSASMGQYVDTVIRDSTLVTRSDGWIFPSFKCIYRAARTALCTSYGSTWMYNTRMYSDSWGNYSMEGANGIEYYYVINGYSESFVGGYGLFTLGMGDDYAAGNNNVWIYGSKMVSPQFGWICDDGPNVTVASMADIAADEHAMDYYDGEITEDMYVTEDGGSFFGGAINAAVLCFDMAPYTEMTADITIKNSVFTTAAEDLVFEDGSPVGSLLDLDPSILHNDTISGGMEYFGLGYVSGATFWLRGCNSDLKIESSDLRSETGVLFHSTIDYSNWSGSNLAGAEAVGYSVSLKDMDVEGDIVHDDYQRIMHVTLDGTTLTGAANFYTCEEYNQRFADYIDSVWADVEASKAAWEAENGAGSSLLGTKVSLLSGYFAMDGSYDAAMTGLELTLENGAVWNVTGVSTLTALNVGDGCTVNGVVTENADGTITVSPADAVSSASTAVEEAPSAEAASAEPASSELASSEPASGEAS